MFIISPVVGSSPTLKLGIPEKVTIQYNKEKESVENESWIIIYAFRLC